MRVRDAVFRNKDLGLNSLKNKETPLEGVQNKSFINLMQDTKEQMIEQELSLLLEEIRLQEERLAKHLTLSEVIRYRKLVSQFLSKIVNNMFEFRKYDYFDHRGRHDVYAVVNKVNQKLEELVQQVLEANVDNLKVLALVDDIRGLLIDLFY